MNDSSIEEALVLELPPPLTDEELGLGFEIELEDAEEATETVDLDDGVVIDIGGNGIDAVDELSWLDAGEDADDLDVGGEIQETGEGWLDDKPMALDFGYEPETSQDSAALDLGAEGLEEPPIQSTGDDDSIDLPPMPRAVDDDSEGEPDL